MLNKLTLSDEKKHLLNIFISLLFTCVCYKLKSQSVDTSKLFPTQGHKQISILKTINVNADSLKMLLVVPNSNTWLIWGKKLNYFNEVMTIADFEKNIIAKGLTEKIPGISDRIGLYKAYVNYRPYVILSNTTKAIGTKRYQIRLNLYDPKRADLIFQNEVEVNLLWESYSDLKILYPLFNSLVDFLNRQVN